MMFYHRDTYVIELQMGTPAQRLEDACDSDHFDINTLPYITLLGNFNRKKNFFFISVTLGNMLY